MTSTPISSRRTAISSFSLEFRETFGVCSPSLRVVSKNFRSENKAIPRFHFLHPENSKAILIYKFFDEGQYKILLYKK